MILLEPGLYKWVGYSGLTKRGSLITVLENVEPLPTFGTDDEYAFALCVWYDGNVIRSWLHPAGWRKVDL